MTTFMHCSYTVVVHRLTKTEKMSCPKYIGHVRDTRNPKKIFLGNAIERNNLAYKDID
jgi:hypothetical protein